MDKLKELLGEELFNQVKEKLGDTKIMVDDGNFIPKARFDQVNEQKKELQQQVESLKDISSKYESLQKDVAKWKEEAEQLPALKKKMEEWETTAKDLETKLSEANTQIESFTQKEQEYQQQIKETRINSEIEKILLQHNARYPDLIMNKFDKSKVELKEDGTVAGIEEQLNQIKENYKDLFGEEKMAGSPPNTKGGSPKPQGDESKLSDEEWFRMKLNEQNK